MLDIAEELNRWVEQGRDFAVATVVAVGGSAPRQPGAALAVDSDGTAIGSVSGGCVEGAVYELCRQALERIAARSGAPGFADRQREALKKLDVLIDALPPARKHLSCLKASG